MEDNKIQGLHSFLQRLHAFTLPKRLRTGLAVFAALCVAACIALAVYVRHLIPEAPDVTELQQARNRQPSILVAADGSPLSVFRQGQLTWVNLDSISPHIIDALISTEDRHFYQHHGIDYLRVLSAFLHTAIGDPEGGSTITQQLARNQFPREIGRARTLSRKLKELITAFRIEQHYSKKEILETYLNTVPFLYNVKGIEAAAQTYYNKSAADLDVLESAMLVGMLKGTHYYNPVVNPERARMRRNVVLAQMVKRQKLSERAYTALRVAPLQVQFHRPQDQPIESASHFVAYARKWVVDWAEQNNVDLNADGLTIQTTLDMPLQDAAVRAVGRQSEQLQNIADVEWSQASRKLLAGTPAPYARRHGAIEPFRYFWNANRELLDTFIRETPEFKSAISANQPEAAILAKLKADPQLMARVQSTKSRLQTGFVAIDPSTGEVKAWVGSRDFEQDQFDHVAQASRQPGSTFKPIVYGAALEQGLSPDRLYQDQAVEIHSVDGGVWRPTDMAGYTDLPMTLRQGLVYSKNTITAQVMQDVGVPRIVSLARSVGINQSRLDPVPSLALGTSSVTLLEMVSAYSTIAQLGEYRKPIVIKKITDREGNVLAEFGSEGERALSRNSAIELIDMLRGAVTDGTGRGIKTQVGMVADIAGKTGTTQNNTDGWFILMHPNLVAGAWVGFNDARVTMRSSYWGQGGHNALLVVGDFFHAALKSKLIDGKAQFPRPVRTPLMASAPSLDWQGGMGAADAAGVDAGVYPAPGTGVIVRRDGERTLIGDAQGIESLDRRNGSQSGMTSADVGKILSGMGRDPITGERLGSSTSSGESGSGAGAAGR